MRFPKLFYLYPHLRKITGGYLLKHIVFSQQISLPISVKPKDCGNDAVFSSGLKFTHRSFSGIVKLARKYLM